MQEGLQVPSVAHGRGSISSETSQVASLSSEKTGKDSTISQSSNPLIGVPVGQLLEDAEKFARASGLEDYVELIQKGALVAQNPEGFENIEMLTEDEKAALRHEAKSPWSQPMMLYYLVIMCSLAAALQGVCSLILVRSPEADSSVDGRICHQRSQSLLSWPVRHRPRFHERRRRKP